MSYLSRTRRKVKIRSYIKKYLPITSFTLTLSLFCFILSCAISDQDNLKPQEKLTEQVIGSEEEVIYDDNPFNEPAKAKYINKDKSIETYLTFETYNPISRKDVYISSTTNNKDCGVVKQLAYKEDVRKDGWTTTFKVECDVEEVRVKDGDKHYLYYFKDNSPSKIKPSLMKTNTQPQLNQ